MLRAVPLTIANAAIDLALIVAFPDFFLARDGHLILVAIPTLASLTLLMRTTRTFGSQNEAKVQKAIDELESEGE